MNSQAETSPQSFEAAFERLQELVEKLESGTLSLDESIQAFEEGIRLIQYCTDILDQAQGRVDRLIQDTEGRFRLEPFEG